MRLMGRSPLQLALAGLGLLLLCVAIWGMAQRFPDFTTERVEPARLAVPAPAEPAR